MPVGGGREAVMYMSWLVRHPNATEVEDRAFIQSLIDDPNNTLKRTKAATSDAQTGADRAGGESPSTSGAD